MSSKFPVGIIKHWEVFGRFCIITINLNIDFNIDFNIDNINILRFTLLAR